MVSNRFAILGALVVLPVLTQVSSTAVYHLPVHHGPIIITGVSPDGTETHSSNWAGYAAEGSNVTSATASWIVPAPKCKDPVSGYAAFWVGIDGFQSKTVEQTGTDSDCVNGKPKYYAWYEFYPLAPKIISSFNVAPGDRITASITYSGGKFTTKIESDKGGSFTTVGTVAGAKRNSAEWIAEAPAAKTGILPLADFGTGHFGDSYTGVKDTSGATIGGKTGAITAFKHVPINLKNPNQSADPSKLSSDGTSFTVTWH